MKHTFRNRKWTINFARAEGDCGECDYDKHVVRISPDLKGELLLDTILHELAHVCWPDLDHDALSDGCTDIAAALTKLGYTRKGKDSP